MQIDQLRCFGATPGSGNPALGLRGDRRAPAARQQYARDAGQTCVFVDAGKVLDYYHPHSRSVLCVHATLAAAYLLLDASGPAASCSVTTALGRQTLTLTRAGDTCFVALAPVPVPQVAADARALLGADALSAPLVASVGSPKLLVQVADAAVLHGLAPDLAALAAWSRAHGVNGCYAWCERADGSIEGRNFNHLVPALEDSATGVAAAALTAVLGRDLRVHQGANVGRNCLMRTRVDGAAILVGGRVERAA